MFSLIISIIAIALVAALALASIYYGGDAFQEGTSKAEASTVVNQGQQVQAAVTMSEIDEKPVTDATLAILVTNDYLKEVPGVRDQNWKLNGDNIEMNVINADVCAYIEAAFDGQPALGADAAGDEQAFGCFTPDSGTTHTAYYKL